MWPYQGTRGTLWKWQCCVPAASMPVSWSGSLVTVGGHGMSLDPQVSLPLFLDLKSVIFKR